MQAREVKTAADAQRIVEERRLAHVKVGVFDVDGVLRGKYLAREKFFHALESSFGFCSVVFGWGSKDQLYDNVSDTGSPLRPRRKCRSAESPSLRRDTYGTHRDPYVEILFLK